MTDTPVKLCDPSGRCDYAAGIAERAAHDREVLGAEKMWFRRALYRACGGDEETVKQMMAETQFTTLSRGPSGKYWEGR